MAISRKPQQVKASEEQIQSIINQGGSVAKNSKSETIVSDKKKSLQLRLDAELIKLIDESRKKRLSQRQDIRGYSKLFTIN